MANGVLMAKSLNDSQRAVVEAMMSSDIPLVIAHGEIASKYVSFPSNLDKGPPGTGKTTTISTAIKIWDNANRPVWVAAQSNVAVKNIAESLLKRDVDFKLLVSKEFYVEW